MRRCVALETGHELVPTALLAFAVRAALAVRTSPVLFRAADVAFMRQETLLMVFTTAARAH